MSWACTAENVGDPVVEVMDRGREYSHPIGMWGKRGLAPGRLPSKWLKGLERGWPIPGLRTGPGLRVQASIPVLLKGFGVALSAGKEGLLG
jgi:hypothetical protein